MKSLVVPIQQPTPQHARKQMKSHNALVSVLMMFFIGVSTLALPAQAFVQFEKRQIKLSYNKSKPARQRTITIEVAETPEQTNHGMMYRQSLKPDEGMLFVFSEARPLSFWMKNTFVDLDIGFFDSQMVLVDIQQMAATSTMQQNLPTYSSRFPAQYALEMPKGWFEKNKFPVGTRLEILKPSSKRPSQSSPEPKSKSK
ncbi:hypothetical protein A11Q_74 [Pseudobdellovibrio exovorus JSS]|uniref:DUF192 domain-containing protein n=1 Tax=Pseudobdellovibrio exovorus JSS TaxID=1184267 RepID=M4VMI1_9BACT|nr:hypothetical protein A11Q_74 [Pseudobdellovibrio exovorus JSS]